MHPLEIALRKIDVKVDPAGKNQGPSLWVLYWDEERPDRIRVSRLNLPVAALASESAHIGPAQKLLMFAHATAGMGLTRYAPGNWVGWACSVEAWENDAKGAEAIAALQAAARERKVHLTKGRREVRVICGVMTDGTQLQFRRLHDSGLFTTHGLIVGDDGKTTSYASDDIEYSRLSGDMWRGLRILAGLPERSDDDQPGDASDQRSATGRAHSDRPDHRPGRATPQ